MASTVSFDRVGTYCGAHTLRVGVPVVVRTQLGLLLPTGCASSQSVPCDSDAAQPELGAKAIPAGAGAATVVAAAVTAVAVALNTSLSSSVVMVSTPVLETVVVNGGKATCGCLLTNEKEHLSSKGLASNRITLGVSTVKRAWPCTTTCLAFAVHSGCGTPPSTPPLSTSTAAASIHIVARRLRMLLHGKVTPKASQSHSSTRASATTKSCVVIRVFLIRDCTTYSAIFFLS